MCVGLSEAAGMSGYSFYWGLYIPAEIPEGDSM